ncbi:EthD domain-containing protein [Talaromyces proteolyticus]|uniref:EthD domain-containing protein n=1 Tax=Talaromyces proteolyticus TaxID=1131652 RepID=A0AAD4KX43_9EURO|nr:EthD domain-containing protein [Talaromyces proteolyticus]KAH8698797.1 EthD domain-containing protein [Talaromyces proteolyticus]
MAEALEIPARPAGDSQSQFLCLTICGYRRPGMSETDYKHHMTQVSAPMTKDLMVKYGVKRWTMIHNTTETRALMSRLFDAQMTKLADFDCFSQVVFKSVDDYKRMKEDPWYKEHLAGDHEKFADTKKSMMTIGWITEFIRDGQVVDGMKDC